MSCAWRVWPCRADRPLAHTTCSSLRPWQALVADGLRRGLHECIKALAKAQRGPDGQLAVAPGGARLAVLAQDCDEPAYTKLVRALCAEKGVPLIEVPAGETIGEWSGLCKIDKEGKPRKIVKTSVAVVTDFGEASNELEILMAHLKGSA